MICIYQRSNYGASMDNLSDLMQLYFAFASGFLSNTLLCNIDQNTNILNYYNLENVCKKYFKPLSPSCEHMFSEVSHHWFE